MGVATRGFGLNRNWAKREVILGTARGAARMRDVTRKKREKESMRRGRRLKLKKAKYATATGRNTVRSVGLESERGRGSRSTR